MHIGGFFSALEIERRAGGASRSTRRYSSGALQIERRPHGASRASSLPRLLQRAMACAISFVSLWCLAIYCGEAGGLDSVPRRPNKAGNHGLAGIGTLQQTWERACSRSAVWTALDLKNARGIPTCTSRSAARAALDLKGATRIKAGASRPSYDPCSPKPRHIKRRNFTDLRLSCRQFPKHTPAPYQPLRAGETLPSLAAVADVWRSALTGRTAIEPQHPHHLPGRF